MLQEWVPVIDARQAAKRQRRSGKTQESKGDSKQDLKAQGKQMIENVRNTLRGAEFQVNVSRVFVVFHVDISECRSK